MLLQRTVRSLTAAAVVLAAATAVHSQTATSTLSGVARDESGAVLSGVTVSARNLATGATRRTATDESGRYSVFGLEPGEYEVRAELTGFGTVVRTEPLLRVMIEGRDQHEIQGWAAEIVSTVKEHLG